MTKSIHIVISLCAMILTFSVFAADAAQNIKRVVYIEIWDQSDITKCLSREKLSETKATSIKNVAKGSGYIIGVSPQYFLLSAHHVIEKKPDAGYVKRCIYFYADTGSYHGVVSFPVNWPSDRPLPSKTIRPHQLGSSDISLMPVAIPSPPAGPLLVDQHVIKAKLDKPSSSIYLDYNSSLSFSGFKVEGKSPKNEDIKSYPIGFQLDGPCKNTTSRCDTARHFDAGYSGAPVFDSTHRLVGIVSTRLNGKDFGTFTPIGPHIVSIKQFLKPKLQKSKAAPPVKQVYRARIIFRNEKGIFDTYEKVGMKSISLRPLDQDGYVLGSGLPIEQNLLFHKGEPYNWVWKPSDHQPSSVEADISFIEPNAVTSSFIINTTLGNKSTLNKDSISLIKVTDKRVIAADLKSHSLKSYARIKSSYRFAKLRKCIVVPNLSIQARTGCWFDNMSLEAWKERQYKFEEFVVYNVYEAIDLLNSEERKLKYLKEVYDISIRSGFSCIAKSVLSQVNKKLEDQLISPQQYENENFKSHETLEVVRACSYLTRAIEEKTSYKKVLSEKEPVVVIQKQKDKIPVTKSFSDCSKDEEEKILSKTRKISIDFSGIARKGRFLSCRTKRTTVTKYGPIAAEDEKIIDVSCKLKSAEFRPASRTKIYTCGVRDGKPFAHTQVSGKGCEHDNYAVWELNATYKRISINKREKEQIISKCQVKDNIS